MVLMLITMILPSMAVVREKEIGTLEQLIVTPVRPWQLILGKLFPFAVDRDAGPGPGHGARRVLFRVPLRGSFAVLALLTVPFLMTTLGLGLFVSTLVRTQQQAMMTSAFVLMMPMIQLSGLIFPIENMPVPIQHGTVVIPLRYYNIVVRGIFLKGAGLDVLWPEGAILTAFGVVVLSPGVDAVPEESGLKGRRAGCARSGAAAAGSPPPDSEVETSITDGGPPPFVIEVARAFARGGEQSGSPARRITIPPDADSRGFHPRAPGNRRSTDRKTDPCERRFLLANPTRAGFRRRTLGPDPS